MSHHGKHEHGQCQCQSSSDHQESTQVLAHQLWEQAGSPEGQSVRFWVNAEEQIKRTSPPATPSLN